MYPRIKLARNLLQNNGVMFISTDDNEYDNLKKICDERGWVIEVKKHSSSYFFLHVRKTKNLPIERSESALRYEFNLSLPNEQRYNRYDEAVKVFSPFL